MRLARDLEKLTEGAIAIESIDLDPDAMRWTYRQSGGATMTVEGAKGLRTWVTQLNAHHESRRLLVIPPNKQERAKIVAGTQATESELRQLLGV